MVDDRIKHDRIVTGPRRTVRCRHGFARSLGIPCAECDHAETGVPIPHVEPTKYDRRRYQSKHASDRKYCCKACGEQGHNKTTCPQNGERVELAPKRRQA